MLETQNEAHGICRLTLNDPGRRNALSEAMLAQLTGMISAAGGDSAIRLVVIAARGPAFCAGHDLKEIRQARVAAEDGGRDYFTWLMTQCSKLMQAIITCPKPVIAEIDGIATAAGCQLVASCDLAIASQNAKFATPGVNIGLFCSTPMVALSRNLSNKHAMEMLLTGDMITADRAAQIGLVNEVVAGAMLGSRVTALARKIASKSSHTVAIGKQAFYRQRELSLGEAYAYTSEVMVENLLAQDASEGIDAFINKRDPEWQDR